MLRLIDDLLDFANIEAGRLAILRQSNDPVEMILETQTGFDAMAEEAGIRLTAHIQPRLPRLRDTRVNGRSAPRRVRSSIVDISTGRRRRREWSRAACSESVSTETTSGCDAERVSARRARSPGVSYVVRR